MAPQQSTSNVYCYTCTQFGHLYDNCTNTCTHCHRSHPGLPCPFALSAYPVTYEQRQKQDKQVIANLKRELARLAEIATEEENKVAKLEGMLAMHRLQKKPEVPAKPQADTKPTETGKKEKGSSSGPTLTLLGVKSWADIGFMQDLPSIQRQRKAKAFNHQVEGKAKWHEDDELSQLFKRNQKWPPPGFEPDANGMMRRTNKAETDTPMEE